MQPKRLNTFFFVLSLILLGCFISLSLSCSKKEESNTVTINGSIDLSPIESINANDIRITLGKNTAALTATGEYSIVGNKNIPGLVMATDASDNPLFMGIIANTVEGANVALDIYTRSVMNLGNIVRPYSSSATLLRLT